MYVCRAVAHTHLHIKLNTNFISAILHSAFCILHFIFVFGFASTVDRGPWTVDRRIPSYTEVRTSPSWVGFCRRVRLCVCKPALVSAACQFGWLLTLDCILAATTGCW
ncbi:unnamed protein product [Ceratitis capitata]|uniref:(Mediterranean fruit fly) hypothetical protein n=1 Tax=Ceratitis capitata TaxID=7213 RepID=A0A811UW16_CERCA|nr:unnamed protein product [Ceratitis capitata]